MKSLPLRYFHFGLAALGLAMMLFVSGCATDNFVEVGKTSTIHVALAGKNTDPAVLDVRVGRITSVAGTHNPKIFFNDTVVSGAPSVVSIAKNDTGVDFDIKPACKLAGTTLVILVSEKGSTDVLGVGTVAVLPSSCDQCKPVAAAPQTMMRASATGHHMIKHGVGTPISVGKSR